MFSILLTIHIIVGVISMLFCVAGVYSVATTKSKFFRFYKNSIWVLTVFEILSGAFVVIINPASLVRFCVAISFYLALIFAVQFLLSYKSRTSVSLIGTK